VFNDTASARAALPGYAIHGAPLTWIAPLDERGRYIFVNRWLRLLYLALLALAALGYRVSGYLPRVFADRRKHALLRAFAAADLVLACGGGYIYAPGPGDGLSGWFGFMLSGCVLALLMSKPLVLLPQSIGPLHDDFQRRAVRWVVCRAALICVRERRSLDLLQQFGCAQRALWLPDMAFGAPSGTVPAQLLLDHADRLATPPAFRVGMTVLNWSGQNFTFTGQAAYEDAMLGCIDALTARGGVVMLFAQCCGPSAAEDDRHVGARLQARAAMPERIFLIAEPLPPPALQAAYGQMEYFIGTRMHSVILALNAGVPALAIGYLHKTSGVLEDLGMANRCYDINTLTAAELIGGFERLRCAGVAPGVAPYLDRARRAKRALAQLIWMLAGGL
jgi:colanic acid/amylovoran biosynthesis protein